MGGKLKPVFFAVLPVVCMTAPAALAQTGGPTLEEVTVTAQRREESLQSVPIAVTALNAKDLERNRVQNTEDLQLVTPNLNYTNFGGNEQPYLRGIGADRINIGADPSVATYVDGVYQAGSYTSVVNSFDVESIEVLRGPQTALYGRNALGGAIIVRTKDPSQELQAQVTAGVGNYNLREVSGSISGGLSSDLAVSLSAFGQKRGSYTEDVSHRSKRATNAGVRLKAVWAPTDRLKVVGSAAYARRVSPEPWLYRQIAPNALNLAFGVPNNLTPYRTATNVTDSYIKTTQRAFSGQATYDFGWARFISTTSYSLSRAPQGGDLDGSAAPIANAWGPDQTVETQAQEVQLISSAEGPLTWIVGALYFDENRSQNGTVVSVPLVGSQQVNFNDWHGKSQEAYAELGWALTPQLKVSVAGRYISEKRHSTTYNNIILPVASTTPLVRSFSDDSKFSPSLTLVYTPSETLMAYAKYAEGFKSGSPQQPTSLKPERVKSYEVGLKSDLFDNRLRLNLAAFQSTYEDRQVQQFTQNLTLQAQNAAKATIKGFEADVTVAVTQGLRLAAAMGYLDAKYDSFPAFASFVSNAPRPGYSPVAVDISGQRLERAPKFTGSVRADYEHDMGDAGTIQLHGDVYMSDDYKLQAAGLLRQKAYTLVGASASYLPPSGRWKATVWGRNLGDAHYLATAQFQSFGTIAVDAAPRTYGVTLSLYLD